ncbi:hypothetical protein WICANDRAFT_45418 [Wickerhamomyces anomalus NRRL Y-366-8]|uniref:U2 small nuclear ribonucleoprotein A' n=1 Tax=Wickerhamomyces anomalus (strain ATCC 58044 / CBS 1984 / NCYC 433 / NRRL Y-366-8) TaxID=683960 RepID=A0A1E3NXY1_WICAA|nr:uncharacterized protein WICANDRAFT_45418 [Wickerhamomyces anomalus NRRL Y-366-8]ODQ58051.1 hypothetical protein WICANDRAFT_45418 [Wickerhamomyces anomalus NRRL Y-366-8]
MRLTPNVLLDAPSFINPQHERTLSLRSLKIPMIENFTVTKDVNEAIDLTDNDIKILGNFPILTRLKTLLLAKNRIQTIQDDFYTTVPMLESLSLISNSLASLSSLEPLKNCKRLKNLYILNNHISQQEHYRLFIIWLIPQLKVLDFMKIKDKERTQANELFGEVEEPTELAKTILNSKPKHILDNDKDDDQIKDVLKKLSEEDREKLKQQLKTATSLSEIDKIETALKNGYI